MVDMSKYFVELVKQTKKDGKRLHQTVLNLAAGKVSKEMICSSFNQLIVNVDMCYNEGNYGSKEKDLDLAFKEIINLDCGRTLFIKDDIFNFLRSTPYKYDLIIANRIFEHQFYDSGQIGELLSCCYSSLNINGVLQFVVPNHKTLAKKLVETDWDKLINSDATETAKEILLLNTEFCNTKSDPHGSIWTPEFVNYYLGQEGVWSNIIIIENALWEGRNCYMLVSASKK